MNKIIFILGPPGSGKTTQAKLLANRFDLALIDGGRILRQKFSDDKVEEGESEARQAYEAGKLVDPARMLEWVREAISDKASEASNSGMVFSGSLRTEFEAKRLIGLFESKGRQVVVVHLDLTLQESIKRNTARDRDVGDQKTVIKKRWQTYQEQSKPVLDWLGERIIHINGQQSVESIHEDITQVISSA